MPFPVKICGITRHDDALLARDLGAFAIGFIFYPKSPRYIEPERAGAISRALGSDIPRIGVFVDAEIEVVRETVQRAELSAVQLHGAESAEYARELRDVTVIKAFRVGEGFDPETLRDFPAEYFLLDTLATDRYGGTGKPFNWALAAPCHPYGKIILAGGLNEGNVTEAIRAAHPWGVDISSGVESSPGVKDPEALRRLFRAIENPGGHPHSSSAV